MCANVKYNNIAFPFVDLLNNFQNVLIFFFVGNKKYHPRALLSWYILIHFIEYFEISLLIFKIFFKLLNQTRAFFHAFWRNENDRVVLKFYFRNTTKKLLSHEFWPDEIKVCFKLLFVHWVQFTSKFLYLTAFVIFSQLLVLLNNQNVQFFITFFQRITELLFFTFNKRTMAIKIYLHFVLIFPLCFFYHLFIVLMHLSVYISTI